MPSRQDWRSVTPFLAFCALTFATADFAFGLDTGTFGNLQAIPGFLNVFGHPNPANPTGKYILGTFQKSMMNSIVYLGRIFGVAAFEPGTERFGFKKMFIALCVVQLVAVIIELTSKEWVQFTVGRTLTYVSIGLIEAVIPTYSAEIAPAPLRGFFAGLFVPLQTLVGMLTSGIARAFANETRPVGWLIPVSLQGMPSILSLSFIWFTVESPRWLVSKGRIDEARRALSKLRPRADTDSGLIDFEVETLKQSVVYEASINGGKWKDLFARRYWRRAVYAALMFAVYEASGNQFYNAYGPTFLVNAGLGAKAFTYGIIVSMMGGVGALSSLFLSDVIGRRPVCMVGCGALVIWCSLIGRYGGDTDIAENAGKQNLMVACFILLFFSTKLAFATQSFIVTTEMGGLMIRKKLMMVGASQDVLWSFLTAFFTPYIMNEINAHIGYIFAAIAGIGFLYAIFLQPELRGRSLEEVEELFDEFRWGWQFQKVKTTGAGAMMAQLEHHQVDVEANGDGQEKAQDTGVTVREV